MPRMIEELVREQLEASEMARRKAIESGAKHVAPVITLSRSMGSGARIIAGILAKELGWSLWDKELLDAIALESGVSLKVVERFDERGASDMEMFVRSVLGDYEMGNFIYARHLVRAVASIAQLGNAIILGRGANIILPNALNVRTDASYERRIENMMHYEQLTREQAATRIQQSDRERECFLIQVFGKHKIRNSHFDISLWMDKFTNDDAVAIIKTAMKALYKL